MLVANQLGYPVCFESRFCRYSAQVRGTRRSLECGHAAGVRDGWQNMMSRVSQLRPEAKINGVTVQNMSGKPEGREIFIGVSTG